MLILAKSIYETASSVTNPLNPSLGSQAFLEVRLIFHGNTFPYALHFVMNTEAKTCSNQLPPKPIIVNSQYASLISRTNFRVSR